MPVGQRRGRDRVPLAGRRSARLKTWRRCRLGTSGAVGLDGVGQIADLVGEAELVLLGRSRDLAPEGVRAPDLGLGVAQGAGHHIEAARLGATTW